jgi:hypothetical protein
MSQSVTFTETTTVSETTTSTHTSLVPAPSGFQFVQDTLNGYPSDQPVKRSDVEPLNVRGNTTDYGLIIDEYPQSVDCMWNLFNRGVLRKKQPYILSVLIVLHPQVPLRSW